MPCLSYGHLTHNLQPETEFVEDDFSEDSESSYSGLESEEHEVCNIQGRRRLIGSKAMLSYY